jgi:hemerythrin-like domain-containing protein
MTLSIAGAPDPFVKIAADHRAQIELCDILESIADRLPEPAERSLVNHALDLIERSWRPHMEFEENCLFPILRTRLCADSPAHDMLNQFEVEHANDSDVLGEIALALEAVVAPRPLCEPVAVGYLFRSFFESQRRHINWETAVVLPLLKDGLQREDFERMRGWLTVVDHKIKVEIGESCQNCGGCSCDRDIEKAPDR